MYQREVKSIYVIAGEASGDLLGGRLLKALYEKLDGKVQFFGVGGDTMQEAGLKSLFPMTDLSVMGFTEILPKLPLLMRRLKETEQHIKIQRPDALITIDAPGFNFRLAKKLQKHPFPIIHYVAPSVWAYHKERAKKCAGFLDHLLTLLPFEPPYFTEHNLSTTFVGHSILESGADQADGEKFRQKHKIDPAIPLICILPGSRVMEINRLAPIFAKSFEKLSYFYPQAKAIVPCLPHLTPQIKQIFRRELGMLYDQVVFVKDVSQKYDAMAACNVAIAASGTVTLELALAKVPMVVAYRLNPLTAMLAKRVLTLDYVTLVNILQNKEIIPEFLQENCTADNIALSVESILKNPKKALQQLEQTEISLKMLRADGANPSEKAADAILGVLGKVY